MMGRRAVAVMVAALLIGGAVAVRRWVIDGESNRGDQVGSTLRLACSAELAATCRTLQDEDGVVVEIAPAGEIARALTEAPAGDPPWDGWLAVAPWPEGVRDARVRNGLPGLLGVTSTPVGRSPLVIALRKDRAEVLEGACGADGITWRCIGEQAGRAWSDLGGLAEWGVLRPAHAEPVQDGIGRLVVGQAVGHFLATPELRVGAVARIDWEGSDAFGAWFGRLENAVPSDAFGSGATTPFRRWIVTGLVASDAVAGLEAEVVPGLAAAASSLRSRTRVVYPMPLSTADVVFVPVGARGADLEEFGTSSVARQSLAINGWRVQGQPSADGIPKSPRLPDTNGLPAAGVLEALAGLWGEIVR